MQISVFGIRHHGCGSARSLRKALAELRPDIVLIEGAPEADEIIHLAAHQEMRPPVAILIYSPEHPRRAVYYPFAEFSPEWQAIRFALGAGTPVRFIDLPQSFHLAETLEQSEEQNSAAEEPLPGEASVGQHGCGNPKSKIRRDPLQFAAEAAGFSDGEVWWENLVETRAGGQTELFTGILELMTVLREEAEKEASDKESARDELREAFMRQQIRRAQKQGFKNIAVVCGAWHAPKFSDLAAHAEDAEKLQDLPKIKLSATWIPYTYDRLSFASGYGAGVNSPEFYHQIWRRPENIASLWLSRVASLLREQDLDASSASVIEAVRLAESLAVMRGLSAVGLGELNDAVRSVLCFGDDAQLNLIGKKLIVGERMGSVPDVTPAVPLQRDVQAAQKRLRFPPAAAQKNVELDLRKPNDLERSRLLHRLNLLGIDWGLPQKTGGKGTFKEAWLVQWRPELEIALIEANVWGNTVYSAAAKKVRDRAAEASKLSELTALVEQTLLSHLPEAVEFLMSQLEAKAAVSSDIPAMMDALPPLADVLRYGNVRKTDAGAVKHVVDGLVVRICAGLPNASAALDDEAAEQMFERISATNNAISLLQDEDYARGWRAVLHKLAGSEKLHGLVAGRSVRLLFDAGEFSAEEVGPRIGLALSTANEPAQAAAWLEGFLRGSGLLLLHNENLLRILDEWVKTLGEETFVQILPLLRRTFSTFAAAERRQIGGRVKGGLSAGGFKSAGNGEAEIDEGRAARVLPLVAQLLGVRKN